MLIKISDKIIQAQKQNKPIVALESTIISHGMPYPLNVKTALQVQQIILDNGAIPATIGIIQGQAIIGLSDEEIEQFGQRKDITKVSTRDLPIVISEKLWGATTVATTMILASKANIEVFVTGGIGGVHRDGQNTLDISADLQQLAKTNVTVVCAGAKAILDLPLTLEYLETHGVPILGYKSNNLAAFYSTDSGLKLDYKLETTKDIANIIKCKRNLNLNGGIIVSNPIPNKYQIDPNKINKAIDKALTIMKQKNIKGKETTPFLLKTIKEITKGESLQANIQLIYNNAKIGALLAKDLITNNE